MTIQSKSVPSIILIIILALILPTSVFASNPPQEPSLEFQINGSSANASAPLFFDIVWQRQYSVNIPPDTIMISIFSVPVGSRLGAFLIAKSDNECTSSDMCLYRREILPSDLPSGTLMLVATDPNSGATGHQMITIPGNSGGSFTLIGSLDQDNLFFSISAILIAILCGMLAFLVRRGSALR